MSGLRVRACSLAVLCMAAFEFAGCTKQPLDEGGVGKPPGVEGDNLASAQARLTKWCDKVQVVITPGVPPAGIDEKQVYVRSKDYTDGLEPNNLAVVPALPNHEQVGLPAFATSSPDESSSPTPGPTSLCPPVGIPVVTLHLYTKVPDLHCKSIREAKTGLAKQGLAIDVSKRGPDGDAGPVLDQSPAPGTEIELEAFPSATKVSVNPGVIVPNLSGVPAGTICDVLKSRQLGCQLPLDYTSKQAANPVATQDPSAGTLVAIGIQVTVVLGPSTGVDYSVPSVVGLSDSDACKVLEGAQLNCSPIGTTPGQVVDQKPEPGTTVSRLSTVFLTVRAAAVQVPNLLGMTEPDACDALVQVNLVCNSEEVKQGNQPGIVVDQQPRPGAPAQAGTGVIVRVSTPETAIVPDVRNQSRDAACRALADSKLVCGVASDASNGAVTKQNPAPGTEVPLGTQVSLTLPANDDGGGIPGWVYLAGAAVLVAIAGTAQAMRRPKPHAVGPDVQVRLLPGVPTVPTDRLREW